MFRITSIKRSPDGDEVRGNGLKWRNKTTIMHCERRGRKFFSSREKASREGEEVVSIFLGKIQTPPRF